MTSFNITPIDIGGCIIDMAFSDDNRGSFTKLFEKETLKQSGIDFDCRESFVSRSDKNVIRGMHFQTFHPQIKLVSVIFGKIYDILVDLRKESNTYGQWRGFYLSSENRKSILIPRGFAHGFLSLCDNSTVMYQCDGAYDQGSDTGILFCDEDIAVNWPVDISQMIVGQRDRTLMSFREFDSKCRFIYNDMSCKK